MKGANDKIRHIPSPRSASVLVSSVTEDKKKKNQKTQESETNC